MSDQELSQDEKNSRVSALQNLKTSRGWELILEDINVDIDNITAKLFGDVPLVKDETIESFQKERASKVELIELPDYLIRTLQEEEDPGEEYTVYEDEDQPGTK